MADPQLFLQAPENAIAQPLPQQQQPKKEESKLMSWISFGMRMVVVYMVIKWIQQGRNGTQTSQMTTVDPVTGTRIQVTATAESAWPIGTEMVCFLT